MVAAPRSLSFSLVVLSGFLILGGSAEESRAQSPHPRQVQTEDWEGCRKCGPDCKGHGLTPNDPEFYTRRPADLTPVGVYAPILVACFLFTIFAVALRQRVRRRQAVQSPQ